MAVAPGREFQVFAGNVVIRGGTIAAPAGGVEIVTTGSAASQIDLAPPGGTGAAYAGRGGGAAALTDAEVDVSARPATGPDAGAPGGTALVATARYAATRSRVLATGGAGGSIRLATGGR